ncbi:cytochrome c1 [Marinobacter nanhaiticus D15-8W]|uniref:Cytochrome c1 n=1 Tax=Marinobacter nanhaiticus D15-8W TaxID=626887 RepID=N6X0A9_9GAMM|nr:cytochrome c1 [Marinobacter nanhaiticus]ENO16877.1 cytochrome c1 [Marinobacter nanhaiticus D15-8W]BES72694.1 cytochrome c1 [Marinobacter nanhaiticus D15-8W]
MRKLIVGLFMLCLPALGLAAGGAGVPLDHMEPDHSNEASLQRGAAMFTNYCMGCHSMEYARYKRVAEDLDIPEELYEENLIFTGAKIGELMKIGMNKEEAQAWFGNPPPDLTLEARLRGESWIYSYLRGFYKDESRPLGVNNVVFSNVGMPHVLVGMQGLCAVEPHIGHGASVDPLSGNVVNGSVCPEWASEGSMTPAEFDTAMYDLTNFLSYMGDPVKLERERLGIFVLIFIAIFFVFAYLLNREYWKDVH